jgi:peptidoglycan-associated lipoprotein
LYIPRPEGSRNPGLRQPVISQAEDAMPAVSEYSSPEFKIYPHHCTGVRAVHWLVAILFFTSILYGCGKKVEVSNVPVPPPPPMPTAFLDASPSTVEAGQTTVVSWRTENASEVRIEPLGSVEPNGSKEVLLTESTTYRVIVKGPGGVQGRSVRVTVMPVRAAQASTPEDLLGGSSGRQDVFFDLDEFSIRSDQQATVQNDAKILKEHPDLKIVIEGHCDELGSAEYNLALGESRADEVKRAPIQAGVNASRIEVISYGKERPFCKQQNEDCWRQNRRAHLIAMISQ